MTKIKASEYKDFDAYELACMNFASVDLPRPDNSDDWRVSAAKNCAIYEAEDYAKEAAWDAWKSHVEYCEDMYERGVGPAWD